MGMLNARRLWMACPEPPSPHRAVKVFHSCLHARLPLVKFPGGAPFGSGQSSLSSVAPPLWATYPTTAVRRTLRRQVRCVGVQERLASRPIPAPSSPSSDVLHNSSPAASPIRLRPLRPIPSPPPHLVSRCLDCQATQPVLCPEPPPPLFRVAWPAAAKPGDRRGRR